MPQSDLIYDVGLHNGDDTAYYLAKGYRVVAVEADPTLAQAGEKRFATEIAQGRLKILNLGIADREGVLPFWICEGKTEWNSFDKASASRNGRTAHVVEVPCAPFSKVLGDHGVPYYLKIDIEGFDRSCLECLDRHDVPTYVSSELTDPEVFARLRDLGYSHFKIVLQNNHATLRKRANRWDRWLCRRLPLYMRSVRNRLGLSLHTRTLRSITPPLKWRFAYGSSGPFGEETDSAWSTYDEIEALWKDFVAGRTEYGLPGGLIWQDVHARKG